jgi:hypothetical protein
LRIDELGVCTSQPSGTEKSSDPAERVDPVPGAEGEPPACGVADGDVGSPAACGFGVPAGGVAARAAAASAGVSFTGSLPPLQPAREIRKTAARIDVEAARGRRLRMP